MTALDRLAWILRSGALLRPFPEMNVALDKDCCSWRASSQDGRLLYLSSEENAAYRIPQAWC